jgi:hypothetical protein
VRDELIATNVWLQLTSTLASASVDVPDVRRLTSRGTRAEERERATQQLCSLLVAGFVALLLITSLKFYILP